MGSPCCCCCCCYWWNIDDGDDGDGDGDGKGDNDLYSDDSFSSRAICLKLYLTG